MAWAPMLHLISEDADTCALVTFSRSAHFYLAISGDGYALFHLNFFGFILIFKDVMVDNIYI